MNKSAVRQVKPEVWLLLRRMHALFELKEFPIGEFEDCYRRLFGRKMDGSGMDLVTSLPSEWIILSSAYTYVKFTEALEEEINRENKRALAPNQRPAISEVQFGH